ncbi:Fcf1-domain-containing protein [Obelidium mucronatum]|nr:Fcf1-domain-containing protein [Obelidium mucronatum]
MRVKRAKKNKKNMALYSQLFGFREPYQLLLDGNFIHVANLMKMDTWTAIPKVLQGQVKPFTTTCVLSELRALGEDFSATVKAAQQLERRRCNHTTPIGATECLKSIIGTDNKHKYGVASQDNDLRVHLRTIPGTPLLYIMNSVLLLEPPSKETQNRIAQIELEKTLPKKFEEKVIKKLNPNVKVAAEPTRTFKKKPKGPNPLSVKRKKTTKPGTSASKSENVKTGEKRKRDSDDDD